MPYLDEFKAPILLARDPRDDELFVLTEFEHHASHCSLCKNSLQTFREGRSLCARGHQYAVDVAKYIYSRDGKTYSAVARGLDQHIVIRIPKKCPAARNLLLAFEEGLRIHRKTNEQTPVISYDRTPPVSSRQPAAQPETHTEIIERFPRPTTNRRRVIVYHRGSPTRGSLYKSDFVDRIERHSNPLRVHRPTEFFR